RRQEPGAPLAGCEPARDPGSRARIDRRSGPAPAVPALRVARVPRSADVRPVERGREVQPRAGAAPAQAAADEHGRRCRARPGPWRRRRPGEARQRLLGGPASNTCRPLARDHAAPESTLALSKAIQPCCGRVRPLAWCSRPRDSAASLAGPSMTFLSPWGAWVAVAVVVPLAAFALLEARARRVSGRIGLTPPPLQSRLGVPIAICVVAAFLAIAAAQPVISGSRSHSGRSDAQVFVLLDVSRSMLARSSAGAPTRLQRAKQFALELRHGI